jgi:serine/threonine protein kinase
MDKSENFTGASLSEQITRDYKIVRLLGKGGMGDVFLAEQLRVGRRPVALKVLNRSCCDDPDLKRRFENEAASAGRIHHPNVVMVYECRATDDGQLYVAMEYVQGFDLGDAIKERGPLPLDEIVEIIKQAAAGLGAAHKLGIVHRDVKPANIMLTRDDDGALVVKVLDFGIARLSEPDSSGALTKTGVVMGTPFYMSPEQALGKTGDKIDRRSDVYSLAMVVYQMLTGRVAFESDSWMQVMYKHINEAPLPPSQARPELGNLGPVEDVIMKGLEKDRDKRQQSVAEFANELQAAYTRLKSDSPREFQTMLYQGTGPAKGAGTIPVKPADKTTSARPSGPGSATPESPTILAAPTVAEHTDAQTKKAGAPTNKIPDSEATRSFETVTMPPPPTPTVWLPGTVQPTAVPPVTDRGSRQTAGKMIAAVVAAVIALAGVVAAIIVIRGGGAAPQQIQLNKGSSPAAAGPEGHKEATGRNPAESKDEAKRETAASKPGKEEPARPGLNPRDNSAAGEDQRSAVIKPGEQAAKTCLQVVVTGAKGKAVQGARVMVNEEPVGMYQDTTGPKGMHTFCGLVVGHRVMVTATGPMGKNTDSKQVVLTAASNKVAIQLK